MVLTAFSFDSSEVPLLNSLTFVRREPNVEVMKSLDIVALRVVVNDDESSATVALRSGISKFPPRGKNAGIMGGGDALSWESSVGRVVSVLVLALVALVLETITKLIGVVDSVGMDVVFEGVEVVRSLTMTKLTGVVD